MDRTTQMRYVIAVSVGLLFLENIQYIPPPETEVVVEEEKPSVQDQLSERKLGLAREAAAYAFHKATGVGPDEARLITRLVEEESNRYPDLQYTQVLGLIVVESKGNPQAISPVGARGLMQIMPETGEFIAANFNERWRGVQTLHDVQRNVRYGVWYLNHLRRDFFPNQQRAQLAAYNWGPQAVLDRREAGLGTPHIYPALVLRKQQQIERDLYEFHSAFFWRSLDLRQDPPRFEDYTRESPGVFRHRDVLVARGEGQLPRSRRVIQ